MVKLSLTVAEQNINNIEHCILAVRTTEEGQRQINAAFTDPKQSPVEIPMGKRYQIPVVLFWGGG